MTHKELLDAVRANLGGTATPMAAELAITAVTRAIRDGIREDGCVKLARFGTFKLQQQQPRRLICPSTHQAITLPTRSVVRFTPSPTLG